MTFGWFNITNKNIRDMYRGLQGFKKGYKQGTWLPTIRVLGLMIPTIFWNHRGITSVSLLSEELMTLLAMVKYSWATRTRIYVSKYEYATEMVKTGHKPLTKFLQKWSDVEIKQYVLTSINWLILQIQHGLYHLRHKKYLT